MLLGNDIYLSFLFRPRFSECIRGAGAPILQASSLCFWAQLEAIVQEVQNIAILGSTGPVGQKVISLLEESGRFVVHEVAAS